MSPSPQNMEVSAQDQKIALLNLKPFLHVNKKKLVSAFFTKKTEQEKMPVLLMH